MKTMFGEEYFLINGRPYVISEGEVVPVQFSGIDGRIEKSVLYSSKDIPLERLEKYEGEAKKLSQNPMKEFDDELRKLKDYLIHEEIYEK